MRIDVRVLLQHALERPRVRDGVRTDLALVDDALVVLMSHKILMRKRQGSPRCGSAPPWDQDVPRDNIDEHLEPVCRVRTLELLCR